METPLMQLAIYAILVVIGYFFGLRSPRKIKYPLTFDLQDDAGIYDKPNGTLFSAKQKGQEVTIRKTKLIDGEYWHRVGKNKWICGEFE